LATPPPRLRHRCRRRLDCTGGDVDSDDEGALESGGHHVDFFTHMADHLHDDEGPEKVQQKRLYQDDVDALEDAKNAGQDAADVAVAASKLQATATDALGDGDFLAELTRRKRKHELQQAAKGIGTFADRQLVKAIAKAKKEGQPLPAGANINPRAKDTHDASATGPAAALPSLKEMAAKKGKGKGGKPSKKEKEAEERAKAKAAAKLLKSNRRVPAIEQWRERKQKDPALANLGAMKSLYARTMLMKLDEQDAADALKVREREPPVVLQHTPTVWQHTRSTRAL
jgi:hypothetical protein